MIDYEILRVENWRLSNHRSFLDHSWMLVSLNLVAKISNLFREISE